MCSNIFLLKHNTTFSPTPGSSLVLHARSQIIPTRDDLQLPSHNFHDVFRSKINDKIQFKDCSSFDYDGSVSKTKDGVPCKVWEEAYSHSARYLRLMYSWRRFLEAT